MGAVLLSFAFALLEGCTKSEAELRQEDRPKIELIIEQDVRASKAMAEADDAARKGNIPGAIEALDQRAKPAIEAGLERAQRTETKTEWGRSKKETLGKILSDRKAEIGPYAEAIKSSDPQKLLDSMEAQAKIERRALAATVDIREGR